MIKTRQKRDKIIGDTMAKMKLPTMREYMQWRAERYENIAGHCSFMAYHYFDLKRLDMSIPKS